MKSTYRQTLDYLYQNLPMFQRVGAIAFKKDLTNTIALCEVLGNPQGEFKSIHIAGTNGKGSSSHMIASVLQTTGYKTGLYTSPHLKEFTERIKVNGVEISQQFVVEFVEKIKPSIETIKPSFFEITVAMAFDYFAKEKVDVAVIEVGLGGRLDSTNIITPVASLITNIGWDHMDLLGDTLKKIASEKAGIIKHGIPVVISERQSEVKDVFIQKAKSEKASITFATDQFIVDHFQDGVFHVSKKGSGYSYELDLKGNYQRKNLPGVLAVAAVLNEIGFKISDADLRSGLANTIRHTSLKGRWQKLSDQPLTICDTGHNEDGIREVVNQLRELKFERLRIVLGMVKDKDITKVLNLLPKDAYYYFCQASIPRAMDAEDLKAKATSIGMKGEVIKNVNEAIAEAKRKSTLNDVIFIGGSTFVVAEIEGL